MISFTLFFEGPDVLADEHIDTLFEAGCDDAVFGERDGAQYATFDREASSLGAALTNAIEQLTLAVPGLEIVRIEPDAVVTMAAIAERVGLSREQVRLLSLGRRGPGAFPPPISYVDHKTRLWYWPDVSRWFQATGKARLEIDDDADLVAALNAALALRRHARRLCDDDDLVLLRRLGEIDAVEQAGEAPGVST